MSESSDVLFEEKPDVEGLYWLGKILIALSQLPVEKRVIALQRAQVLVDAYGVEG